MAIKTFRDKETKKVWEGEFVGRFEAIAKRAFLKLLVIDSAASLEDLRTLKGNRLEALKGGRVGQFSIRVNDQYRICFTWTPPNADDVELTDYH